MAYKNGKIYDIVDYNYQQNFAFYLGEGIKYRIKEKIGMRAELGHYFFKNVKEERSHFISSQHTGINAKASLSILLGINYYLMAINPY